MSLCSALRTRHAAAGGCRRLRGVPPPPLHIRSASEAEAGTRGADGEHLWEAAGLPPFATARIGSFFQEKPVLKNPFLEDALLRGYLRRHLPQEVSREPPAAAVDTRVPDRCDCVSSGSQTSWADLSAFGERIADEVDDWGRKCEVTPPRLVHFDPWGRRVDRIVTSSAWKRMKDLSAQEGLVALGYERSYGEWR